MIDIKKVFNKDNMLYALFYAVRSITCDSKRYRK